MRDPFLKVGTRIDRYFAACTVSSAILCYDRVLFLPIILIICGKRNFRSCFLFPVYSHRCKIVVSVSYRYLLCSVIISTVFHSLNNRSCPLRLFILCWSDLQNRVISCSIQIFRPSVIGKSNSIIIINSIKYITVFNASVVLIPCHEQSAALSRCPVIAVRHIHKIISVSDRHDIPHMRSFSRTASHHAGYAAAIISRIKKIAHIA